MENEEPRYAPNSRPNGSPKDTPSAWHCPTISSTRCLTAAWHAGALKQDVSQLIAQANLKTPHRSQEPPSFKSMPQLPPILHPQPGGATVDVGLGDLAVDLSFDQANGEKVTARAFLSVRMGANLSLTPQNELDIKLSSNPKQLLVHIVSVEGFGDSASNQFNEFIRTLAPKLAEIISTSVIRKNPDSQLRSFRSHR